jgi:hypothetical protein
MGALSEWIAADNTAEQSGILGKSVTALRFISLRIHRKGRFRVPESSFLLHSEVQPSQNGPNWGTRSFSTKIPIKFPLENGRWLLYLRSFGGEATAPAKRFTHSYLDFCVLQRMRDTHPSPHPRPRHLNSTGEPNGRHRTNSDILCYGYEFCRELPVVQRHRADHWGDLGQLYNSNDYGLRQRVAIQRGSQQPWG